MYAPQRFQVAWVQALYAYGQASDACVAVRGEFLRLKSSGIGFQRDLGIDRERNTGANRVDDLLNAVRREYAGRPAAEKHRIHFAAPDERQC